MHDLLILSKEVVKHIELLTIIMKPSFISDIEGSDKVYLNTNKLISILNYDGMPLTANFIVNNITEIINNNKNIKAANSPPIKIV